MNKRFAHMFAVAVVGLSLSGAAWSHPNHDDPVDAVKPQANRYTMQLTSKDGIATVQVKNNGKDVSTAGATGTLSVPAAGGKTDVALQPTGGNKMATKDKVALARGTKVMVSLTLSDRVKVSEELVAP